ncbi:hypothetical protein BGX29_003861 [Mortierella sp. GBA35]|nr:hypothetical protein BGX29_003861 [Mortierella sp. GBA35]
MASPSPLSPTTISPSLSLLTSPVSATILDPIHYFSLMIPEGAPTAEERQELARELAEIHEATVEARQACTAVHGSIQQYQQLVLSTHAQVAAAKLALVQARELVSKEEDESDGDATTTSSGRNANSFDDSDSPSSSSSSSSPSSDVDDEDEDMETRLDKLGERHAILGRQLSQLLRDKAAAEETKKRLNDGLLRAKARIKAIELKLGE